jgi:tetratricopeptide (TPR) repeat protein
MYNKIFADYFNAIIFGTPNEAIRYVEQMIALNEKVPYNYINLGDEYNRLFQYDKAIPEYERAFEIYKKWGIKPGYLIYYTELGKAYHNSGMYRKERKLYKKAECDFPDNPALLARKAILSLSEEDTVSANQYIREYRLIRNNSWSKARVSNGIAVIYSMGDYRGIAERFYREAHALEPQNTTWMNNLGFFLIDEGREPDEGLELIDTALNLDRDNYLLLDSKGWGLYKKGRSGEALDLIQKSWELRLQHARYDHAAYLRMEEVKKAVEGNN